MSPGARGLRVGVDARSLLQRHPRGEGKTLLKLYTHLVAQRPHWKITFFGDQHTPEACLALPPGVQSMHMTLPGNRYDSWENLCLPLMSLRAGCDVLHCASSSGPRWSPAPSVLTVHDLIPVVADDGVDAAFKQAFLRRLKNGLRHARKVIAVSENTRQDLLRTLPETQVAIDVVHWGASEAQTRAQAIDDSTPFVGPTAPYLMAFGGEAPRKNTAYVLDRFAAVAGSMPSLQLVLVGVTGERERRAVSSRIAQTGLEGSLHMPGFVDEAQLDLLLRRALALFYPSLYEGFGMPVLEAIERGVPVVASNLSSLPEILLDVPGCFDLTDTAAVESALQGLASDDAYRADWAARQRGVLSRFDWAGTARKTAALLESAAGG